MKGAEKKEKRVEYVVKVLRAKDFTEKSKLDTNVAFDMEVNGIKIYGCWLKEGTSKEGKDYSVISLPSQKGKDGKPQYQDVCFPVTKEFREKLYQELMDCYHHEKEKRMKKNASQQNHYQNRGVGERKTKSELPFR